jgi:hypothetical protein
MSILLIAVATVKDWKALEQLHDEHLVVTARDVGALRYGTYRNVYDASQVLLLIELPDHDAAREMRGTLSRCLGLIHSDDTPRAQAWEPMNWMQIG